MSTIKKQTTNEYLQTLKQRAKVRKWAEKRCFDKQLIFMRDPSRRRLLFTARRCGKSDVCATLLVEQAILYPGRINVFLGLTKLTALASIKEPLDQHLKYFGLDNYNYTEQDGIIRLSNGSSIKIGGLDASPREKKKLRGAKIHLCIIDECQDIPDLQGTIDYDLSKALLDYRLSGGGLLVLAGTPGEIPTEENYWYRLTKQDETGAQLVQFATSEGFTLHRWSIPENPHTAAEFADECAELHRIKGPAYRDEPKFRRESLGLWPANNGAGFVYRFDEKRDTVRCMLQDNEKNDPDRKEEASRLNALLRGDRSWKDSKGCIHRYIYVIGCDIGHIDATGFSICAYSMTDQNFYVIKTSKIQRALVDHIAGDLIGYNAIFHPARILIDSAGGSKVIAESIRREHGLPIQAAQKPEKQSHVARMNADFATQRIKVIAETNPLYIDELKKLRLDQRAWDRGEWKEAEKFQNHLCDATLYAFKDALHHFATEAEKPNDPRSFEAAQEERFNRTYSRGETYQLDEYGERVDRYQDPYDMFERSERLESIRDDMKRLGGFRR